jgi:hypothetical protein
MKDRLHRLLFRTSPRGLQNPIWPCRAVCDFGHEQVHAAPLLAVVGLFGGAAFPNWSKSGDYVYFLDNNQPSVVRIRIRDLKTERMADLKSFRVTGQAFGWLGLTPDDSPLLLRDIGTQEIYALD